MKMKIKALAIALALSVMMLGCGTAAAGAIQNTGYLDFKMSQVGFYGDFRVYRDSKTSVQYIVFKDNRTGAFGIVPRYNADGSLYVGG